jgi:hypothetical protein
MVQVEVACTRVEVACTWVEVACPLDWDYPLVADTPGPTFKGL